MAGEVKSGIGYIVPAGALVGFIISLLAENYLLAIFFAIAGVLFWFLYMIVMETSLPGVTGNIIILFGVLLSVGVFLAYGWEQNLFGGVEFRAEGSIFALIILFFSVLAGVLFNRGRDIPSRQQQPALSAQEQEAIRQAVEGSGGETGEPKVIVVKQEPPPTEEKDDDEPAPGEYDPYLYAYPPEYYEEDEDDEYDDEYDYEDEDYEDEEEEEQ